ncbi:MAG: serine protease [Candidatus Bipolaricaulota bacterium]
MTESEHYPRRAPDFAEVEEEQPRRLRWLLWLLALGVAAAMLVTAITRMLLPGSISWGSGLILGDGYVLTCEHVVQNGETFTVYWDGRAYEAEVIETSRSEDLALLEVEELDGEGLPWSRWRVLGPGDVVVAVGYPAGSPRSVSISGEVLRVGASAMVPGDVRLENVVLVHGAYEGGMSGAPVVNMWGEVVGLVSGTLAEGNGAGIGLAVSADAARRWLAGIAPEVDLGEGETGERLELSQVANATGEVAVRLEVTPGLLDAQEPNP